VAKIPACSKKKMTVSAIVPVFDEEKTVGGVIEALLQSPLLTEVIAVNDGCTDKSTEILRGFGDRIKLIEFKKNRGKGAAMAEGVKKAKGEIIVFWDADFPVMKPNHVQTLLKPLLSDEARIAWGHWLGGQKGILDDISGIRLTGERAYYKEDLIPHLNAIAQTRFGVEVYLNDVFKNEKTVRVHLEGLRGLYKYEKFGPQKALKEYLKEAVEVARAFGQREVIPAADIKILERLPQVTSLEELKKLAGKIKTKRLRELLDKYFLQYIRFPR